MLHQLGNIRPLLGAIVGDIVGSVYEWNNVRRRDVDLFAAKARFTDDTAMSVAVAECLLRGDGDYAHYLQAYGRRYPRAGYGGRFKQWLQMEQPAPYNSYGNGSAMRVSAVALFRDSLAEVLEEAERSAAVTHNHEEGIKGAQALAGAIFLAQQKATKAEIRQWVEEFAHYDLSFKLDDIRHVYQFDVSCQGSVPQAIVAFLESVDFESALRGAISIGGDSDTIASMAGALAASFYDFIPYNLLQFAYEKLNEDLMQVLRELEGACARG